MLKRKIFTNLNMKLHILSILTIVFSASSFQLDAQELDARFLDSLPESMREDIEDQVKGEQGIKKEETVFRADTSQLKNAALLEELRDKIRILGHQIEASSSKKADGELEIFGTEIFRSFQTTFSPTNLPGSQEGYILDFGDVLKIQIEGKNSQNIKPVVNRDGSINIKGVGAINVAGVEFNKAVDLITKKISENALGAQAYISLESLKQVQVLLTGSVNNPGVYTLNGNSTVLHALDVAGGVQANGSFRKIDHLRDGKVISSIDLYDLFLLGKNKIQPNLRSGDSVYVHQIFLHIPILGGVGREAIYEFLPGETVSDAIIFAGGLSQYASGDYVNLYRYENNSEEILTVKTSNASNTTLVARDYISVPSVKINPTPMVKVMIEGMVNRPGEFLVPKGAKLSDVLSLAGGLSKNAYPFGGALYRESNKAAEMLVIERIYKDTINFLASNLGNPAAPSASSGEAGIALILEEFKASTPMGRVISEFNQAKLANNPHLDILIEDQDQIVIPPLSTQVYLFGEFNDPGARRYDTSLSLQDYISSVGKLKKSSDKDLLIIGPDGTTTYYQSSRLSSIFSEEYEIYPGTIIYAPRSIGKVEGIQLASVVAPILSSLAISLASLNSINN